MATLIGIGFSNHLNAKKAAHEATLKAKNQLMDKPASVALVFSSINYDPQQIIKTVHADIAPAKIIGSTTAGLILPETIETTGVAVLAIHSEDIHFGTSCIQNINTGTLADLGRDLATQGIETIGQHTRHGCLFFIDGRLSNNTQFLNGMEGVFGNMFPIIGAGASDDFKYKQTFQFHDNQAFQHSAVSLVFGGNVQIGVGSRHGWRPLGKPRIADNVFGNIIRTINGKPAADLYREYLGDDADAIAGNKLGKLAILYPLGINIEGSPEFLVRNVVDMMDDGSIVCQGEIPEGANVHVMIGNKEACMAAAVVAAQEAQRALIGKTAKCLIIIECMTRLKLLGRLAHQEIQSIRQVFGEHIPIIGMYSNGEICPLQTTERFNRPHHQNESIIVIAVT